MKNDLSWWIPGSSGTLLSTRWVQVFVCPLPSGLSSSELETSLKYRAKALVPTADHPVFTRVTQANKHRVGLVILNRLPESQLFPGSFTTGMPLSLPPEWPEECLLAVATPEGWEIHRYDKRVLSRSFPPVVTPGATLERILEQNRPVPVFWASPDKSVPTTPPLWARTGPPWPKERGWGIPLAKPKDSRWPWLLGTLLLAAGFANFGALSLDVLNEKEARNQQWESWIRASQGQVGTGVSTLQLKRANTLNSEPIAEVLDTLAVWSSEVQILRIDLQGGKISLTARSKSALSAVERLANSKALSSRWKVVQIRQVGGTEEFDLEGNLYP